MAVFFVTMAIDGARGAPWFPFEIEGVETMAAVFAMLKSDGAILGKRITLSKEPEIADRRIATRQDCILGRAAIGMIRLPHFSMDGEHGWSVPDRI